MMSERPQPADGVGTRIVSGVIGLALGGLFGAMGTVASQSVWHLSESLAVPTGLAAALLATTLLLLGLRIVLNSRLVAVLAAVGIVGATFILAQQSTGGSVLVPATSTLGLVWIFAVPVIALLVLAWPRLSRN